MKNIYTLLIISILTSCNDFLDREPLDFGNESTYYKTVSDLEMAANKFYEYLPTNNAGWGGLYTADTQSDNQVSITPVELFYHGNKKTVSVENSQWSFANLRNINFFINKTRSVYQHIEGNPTLRNHYLGEGYFFRAYEYFRLLSAYGDVPIVSEMQTDDRTTLSANSRRYPRNEVARYILSTLDSAAMLMYDYAPVSGRVARGAAWALKSRVALFEATWEHYHAETCFVPGNDKWLGKDANKTFHFRSGSADAEVRFFLEQAISAADNAITLHSIGSTPDSYESLFNTTDAFDTSGEVILARYYADGVAAHSCSAYLSSGGGCGLTRAAVNTYLMTNGLPIYAAEAGYGGDSQGWREFDNRDKRLSMTVRAPGVKIVNGDTVYFYRPHLLSGGNDKSTTGYELSKYLSRDASQQTQYNCTTAVPIFRAAECLLNYLEAYYMLHGTLDNKCDIYWRALRRRAGVDTDYHKTIAATDISQENDLAAYSRSKAVDATLYSIRRERRCELMAEGLRLNDLRRWRALDSMQNYHPEGFNLWDEMYKMYSPEDIGDGIVSQKDVSKYLRPLQTTPNAVAFNGYSFPKPHYLEPIPLSEFLLVDSLYQNPGWPSISDGIADYSYDCD